MDISSAQNVLKKLEEMHAVSYSKIISDGVLVPKVGGVYAWILKDSGTGNLGIRYVGESENLHDQIKNDCTSSANSLMRQNLKQEMIRNKHGYDESGLQDEDEHRVNELMGYQAYVAWVEEPEHKEVGEYIIETLKPLLNKKGK